MKRGRRRKKQPPRWAKQLNYSGLEKTSREADEVGLTRQKCTNCGFETEVKTCERCGRQQLWRGGANTVTFRDIIILRTRSTVVYEAAINWLRHEKHAPDVELSDLEVLVAGMRESPPITGNRMRQLEADFLSRFDEIAKIYARQEAS